MGNGATLEAEEAKIRVHSSGKGCYSVAARMYLFNLRNSASFLKMSVLCKKKEKGWHFFKSI